MEPILKNLDNEIDKAIKALPTKFNMHTEDDFEKVALKLLQISGMMHAHNEASKALGKAIKTKDNYADDEEELDTLINDLKETKKKKSHSSTELKIHLQCGPKGKNILCNPKRIGTKDNSTLDYELITCGTCNKLINKH